MWWDTLNFFFDLQGQILSCKAGESFQIHAGEDVEVEGFDPLETLLFGGQRPGDVGGHQLRIESIYSHGLTKKQILRWGGVWKKAGGF